MRFDGLDLNLLVALNALLTEQNVSVAAERVHLSQSAMSGALNRLREYFDDELLVPAGRRMAPTARGQSLVEPVRNALMLIRTSITEPPRFDAAASKRRITMLASDYMIRVLVAGAIRRMTALAPQMTFDIGGFDEEEPGARLDRGEVDLLLTIEQYVAPDHPRQLLFEDEFVVVACRNNPAFDREIDAETYSRLGHVIASHGRSRHPAFDVWFAKNARISRRIEVVAPAFTDVALFLSGTERIGTMHRRLAERMARRLPLKIAPVPFPVPPLRLMAQRHRLHQEDPALAWVIEHLEAEARAPAADWVF